MASAIWLYSPRDPGPKKGGRQRPPESAVQTGERRCPPASGRRRRKAPARRRRATATVVHPRPRLRCVEVERGRSTRFPRGRKARTSQTGRPAHGDSDSQVRSGRLLAEQPRPDLRCPKRRPLVAAPPRRTSARLGAPPACLLRLRRASLRPSCNPPLSPPP